MKTCKFILFLLIVIFICILFCFYGKESYKDTQENDIYYNILYLQKFFNLYNSMNKNNNIVKVNRFLDNVCVVFICLKRFRERFKNIEKTIEKYQLKNYLVIHAIDFKKLKKDENKIYIKEKENYYFINDISTENEKEIACTLSHLKSIIESKKIDSQYYMFCEDDITFDYIQFSEYTVEELYSKLPDNDSYLSLYTNKPDYKNNILNLKEATIENGFYGTVSYVISKNIRDRIINYTTVSNNKYTFPKRNELKFVSDSYIPSLFKNYHLGYSIIIPNNTNISSSIHNSHDFSHIELQYYHMLFIYYKTTFKRSIPSNIILYKSNPFQNKYIEKYPESKFFFIKNFPDGVNIIKEKGGIFIFSNDCINDIKISNSLLTVTNCYIISIKNHPYLDWIKDYGYLNIKTNLYLSLPLSTFDYTYSYIQKNEKFVFIIPSYNNEKWVEKNLSSILSQKNKNWFIYYIDDCSTDHTIHKVYQFVKKNNIEDKIQILKNKKRMFQAYSRNVAYQKTNDNDILVFLDGDDWLYGDNVLDILEIQYNKGYVSSYGSSIIYKDGEEKNKRLYDNFFPLEILRNNSYRSHEWTTTHLKTCRSYLIKSIPEKQLKDKNGNWLQHSTDMAIWFWVLEQAKGNIKWIQDILCVYNMDNSLNHSNSWFYNSNNKNRQDIINYIRSHK